MKSIKKVIGILSVVGVLGIAGIAYAEGFKSPADIASILTGKSVAELNKERSEGKTYGTIAKESGKLDEFKALMLEQRKAALDSQVKAGRITQEQADQIYNNIKNNQATCDITGNANSGRSCGVGSGKGQDMGCGAGYGSGNESRRGDGFRRGGCMGSSCGM